METVPVKVGEEAIKLVAEKIAEEIPKSKELVAILRQLGIQDLRAHLIDVASKAVSKFRSKLPPGTKANPEIAAKIVKITTDAISSEGGKILKQVVDHVDDLEFVRGVQQLNKVRIAELLKELKLVTNGIKNAENLKKAQAILASLEKLSALTVKGAAGTETIAREIQIAREGVGSFEAAVKSAKTARTIAAQVASRIAPRRYVSAAVEAAEAAKAAARVGEAAPTVASSAEAVAKTATEALEAVTKPTKEAIEAVAKTITVAKKAGDIEKATVVTAELAEELVKGGAKVEQIVTSTGRVLKIVRVATKVLVVVDVVFSLYDLSKSLLELEQMTRSEKDEAAQMFMGNIMINRLIAAAQNQTPEKLARAAEGEVVRRGEEALQETDPGQKLTAMRNFAIRVMQDARNFQIKSQEAVKPVDPEQTTFGRLLERAWDGLTAGYNAAADAAFQGITAFRTKSAESRLSEGEKQVLGKDIEVLEGQLKALEAIKPGPSATQAEILSTKAMLLKAIAELKKTLATGQRTSDADYQAFLKQRDLASKARAGRTTAEYQSGQMDQKELAAYQQKYTVVENQLTLGLRQFRAQDKKVQLTKLTQLQARLESLKPATTKSAITELAGLEKQIQQIISAADQKENLKENAIPTVVVHEVRNRIKNDQRSGNIPYQGRQYTFSYLPALKVFSIETQIKLPGGEVERVTKGYKYVG